MIKKFFENWLRKETGFAIIELLAVIFLVGMTFTALIAAIINASRQSSLFGDQLIAANLAQEGAEMVYKLRDDNWLAEKPFNQGLSDGVYRIAYNDAALTSNNPSAPLNYDPSGFYSYNSGGTATPFSRTITIANVAPYEIQANIIVSWTTRGRTYSVNVEDHLYDWLP